MAWEELTEEEKCMTGWLEKTYHGIAWSSGDIPYHRLNNILKICTQGVEKIFIKGEQKAQWMRNILPNISISNVEDYGCPPLEEIQSQIQYFCFNHDLCICRKPMCAIYNVVGIRTWLLDYLIRLAKMK
ncbi:uncharacterized protein LOC116417080 [Nasonia vitripennis]|uniref:Uncharacterized protein n=1 Tax=Nasonia vitripennis TaxID=7425 RepID=A0A7M7QBT7_NASVI|nr:uncharacterized protein LOC116417080 [Nasonia vitripennis]